MAGTLSSQVLIIGEGEHIPACQKPAWYGFFLKICISKDVRAETLTGCLLLPLLS